MSEQEVFDRAYDRGNYAQAYQNVGIGVGQENGIPVVLALTNMPSCAMPKELREKALKAPGVWSAGFTLGVYSSFEAHEVGAEDLEQFKAALAFARKLGLDTHRDENSEFTCPWCDTECVQGLCPNCNREDTDGQP